ncbi:sialin-like [Phymastichus coffea]|uniref:sialin-like n=1 Tax=Phymastichus coffea TaxID=108790 RepID=UPI00273C3A89|nr:sialin-like [Phymastichus coffea]
MQTATWMFWNTRRYMVSFLAFFGFLMIYVLRVNLSIAIVKMTEKQTVTDVYGNITYIREFDWDTRLQGYVLSSFFYGYIATPLVGGWLAARIGGKRVFGLGIAVTALFTCITPPATRLSIHLLLVIRVIEGLFEGVTYPAINAIMANWAPPLERSRLTTLAYAGSFVGTVLAMPICSIMAERLGWSSLFYVFGVMGLIWYVCWCYVVSDRPEDDNSISDAELKYIKDSLGSVDDNKISHPWKAMLSSPAVWAIITAHCSENWGFYTMITQLPTFMNDALDFDLEKAGFLSALPYFAMATMLVISGQLADCLRAREILGTTQVRKSFTCLAFVCQAIFMTCTACVLKAEVAVSCITLAIGLGGFAWSGFCVNYLDIAPRHASVLFGIGNTVATLPGIISPVLTGHLVRDKTADEWRIVFLIASGFYIVGAIVYGLLASGEQQHWATKVSCSNNKAHDSRDNAPTDVETR